MTEYLPLLFTAAFFLGLALLGAGLVGLFVRPGRAAAIGASAGFALFVVGLAGPWLVSKADCRGDLACEVVSDLEN